MVEAERQWASAAEFSEDLVEADAGPHRDRLGSSPLGGAPWRYHGARTDEAFEVRCVGVEWAELCHGSPGHGDHRAFTGLGDPHRLGETRPELADADRSAR